MGPGVGLLLPGQGSQQQRMAAGLYGHDPVFTAAMDDFFDAGDRNGAGSIGAALRRDWLAEAPSRSIDDARWSQPLLFGVGHALGRLVLSWGVRPVALLGHSVGELAAATLCDIFTLADATAIVLDRIDRVQGAPAGGMLAVAAGAGELAGLLPEDVAIGALNAPKNTVLAGPTDALDRARTQLTEAGLVCVPVPSTTAFHSPVLAPVFQGADVAIARMTRQLPAGLDCFSGYTAAALGAAEIGNARFWARQPIEPVLFWPALQAMLDRHSELTIVECGPGRTLSAFARRHQSVRQGRCQVVTLLPARSGDDAADRAAVAAARAELAAAPALT